MPQRTRVMMGFFIAFILLLFTGIFLMNHNHLEYVTNALLGFAVLIIVFVVGYTLVGFFRPNWVKQVMQNGKEAQAIVSANTTHKRTDGNQGKDVWLDLPVKIQTTGEGTFEAKMKCRLSQTLSLQNGTKVTVRYNPANKKQVVLVGRQATDKAMKRP